MRIFTTLVACAMSIGASSLAHAQSMGKPRSAPAAAAADTQHMAASDSTAKKAGRMQSPAAKHDQMGKNAMANDPMGTSSPQHENHGPSTRKPRSPSAARDTAMTKPHTMSKDSSAVMKKRSAA